MFFKKRGEQYEFREVIGEGSYGVVRKCFNKSTGELVAIKKMNMGSQEDLLEEGAVKISIVREFRILKDVKHPNLIELKDVYIKESKYNFYLVYELMEADLRSYINNKNNEYGNAEIKSVMHQLLTGVKYLHNSFVIHRDLKPDNILLSSGRPIKITDFGLAKPYCNPDVKMSPQCCTIWYRAPELMFGAEKYASPSDIWSVGCIFGELLLRNPLFPCESGVEIEQLGTIFSCLGTPTEETWPGVTSLPKYIQFEIRERTPLEAVFSAAPKEAVDLLSKMLLFDPNKRITAEEALNHEYFKKGTKMIPTEKFVVAKEEKKKMIDEEEEDGEEEEDEDVFDERNEVDRNSLFPPLDVSNEIQLPNEDEEFMTMSSRFNKDGISRNLFD